MLQEELVFSGAQIVFQSLIKLDCNTLFFYPGGTILPLLDIIDDFSDDIRAILMRHEQGIAHAATGYARISKKPAVCLATSGPGVSNLVTGIADAMMDGTPMICISGQVDSSLIGTNAFQEVDVVTMTAPICKWNRLVTKASDISSVIYQGYNIAMQGRPGPVVIDITMDALLQKDTFAWPSKMKNKGCSDAQPLESDIDKIASRLNTAKKPIIIAGQGVLSSGAEPELLMFSEKTDIPIVTTLMSQELAFSGHDNVKGMIGTQGNYASTLLSDQADVVLILGCRISNRIHGSIEDYLSGACVIHVDIDDNVFNRFITPEITVHSDVKFFLQALIPQVNASEYLLWNKEFSELKEVEIENVLAKSLSRTEGPITMVEFMHVLSEKTQKDSILITDVGEHQMIASKIYQSKHAHSLVTSGGYGTMGFGLPAAIGAKIAAPNHQAILIAGDGGFQMTLQELQVLSQEALDIKIVILNNIRLGMIQFWQDVFYAQHESYSKITSPNFDLIANAYGIPSRVLTKRSDLVSAIDELLSSPSSFLLDVHTDPEEGCFPIIPKGIDKVSMIFN